MSEDTTIVPTENEIVEVPVNTETDAPEVVAEPAVEEVIETPSAN